MKNNKKNKQPKQEIDKHLNTTMQKVERKTSKENEQKSNAVTVQLA